MFIKFSLSNVIILSKNIGRQNTMKRKIIIFILLKNKFKIKNINKHQIKLIISIL